jgi:hypothetical protein
MNKTRNTILQTILLVAVMMLGVVAWPYLRSEAKVLQFSITRLVQAGGTSSIALNDTGGIALTPISGQGVTVGNGSAPVKKFLTGTASVDFTALAAGTCETFTVTVTGAADGDPVYVGIPTAAWATTEYATIQAWVSAANTVTVKRCNLTNATTALSNPAAVTVRAVVVQF